MSSPTLPTRTEPEADEKLTSSFAGAILLHVVIAGSLLGWSLFSNRNKHNWGEHATAAGAIQATMVNSLPLPPRQRTLDTGVLTSEKPSPAPTPPKPKAVPPPRPKEILIPTKVPPPKIPPRVAPVPTPDPPKRPQPTPPPPPTKATTGETAGNRIPQATAPVKNGTASTTVEDKTFGERYAYYVKIVNQKVASNWFTQEADPRASNGKRVTIIFEINREGVPENIRIEGKSGSPTLDSSALRALQRVDGFGPLPAGNRITVEYAFDYRQP